MSEHIHTPLDQEKNTTHPSPGGTLSEALAKAQLDFKPPKKNKHVDFTPKNGGQRVKYSYADLADVIESCREPLAKNGLAIINELNYIGETFVLKTTLCHSSGQFVETFYPLPPPLSTRAQEFGSALTYARRYSLSALLNIASEEDDDGANAPDPKPPEKKPVKNYAPQKAQSSKTKAPEDIPQNVPKYIEEMTILDELYAFVKEKRIEPFQVSQIIEDTTGRNVKAAQLSDDETLSVLKNLQLQFQ